MAEATIATGIDQSNVGEGAIIFNNSETLKSLQENLNDLDKAQEQRVAKRNLAIANNQKFLTALNPKLDGIFPGDKDAILAETQKLQDMGVAHLKSGRNPESQAEVNQQQEKVAALVEVSKTRNKTIAAATEILNKDGGTKFNAEDGHVKLATLAGVPLNELTQNPQKYFNGILQTKTPDLDLAIDDLVNKTFKQPTVTSTFEKDASGNVNLEHKLTENFPLKWAKYTAANAANMPALNEALDKSWQMEKQTYPTKAKANIDKYIAAGEAPSRAEDLAKADFMEGKLLYGHYKKSDEWIPKGETQQAKMARVNARIYGSELKEAQKYQGDAAVLSQMAKGVAGSDKAFSNVTLEPYNDVVSVDGVDKAVKVPNSIVSIALSDPADPTKGFDLVTSESQALYQKAKQQYLDPAGNALGVQIPSDISKIHLPTINALRIYIGNRAADKKWAQGVDLAFRAKDAILPDNADYSPDKFLSLPSTQPQVVKKTTGASSSSTQSTATYNIKGKDYSLKQLQDLGYTEEQVSKYKK